MSLQKFELVGSYVENRLFPEMPPFPKITFVAAVNDSEVLEQNLLRSPCLQGDHPHEVLIQKGYSSAAKAYNEALSRSSNDLIVFCHQDIYFPEGWIKDVSRALEQLTAIDANWGVLGCSGVSVDRQHWRYLYSSGLGISGSPLQEPKQVQTLDEVVLIMRTSSGLKFDDNLPHFHLYGADICLRAIKQGRANYVISAFCIHNTNQPLVLPKEFYECCQYVKRSWREALPIQTTCVRISTFNLRLQGRRLREAYLRYVRRKMIGGRRLRTIQPLLQECAEVLGSGNRHALNATANQP